jgi:Ca2+-binding RTX toxin-like protein
MAVVSITTYGVVADSGLDQTAAINAAIQQAKLDGNDLSFPAGDYLVSGDITLADGVDLFGSTSGFSRLYANSAGDAVSITNGGVGGVKITSIEIDSFHFDNVNIDIGSDVAGITITNNFFNNTNAENQIILRQADATISGNVMLREEAWDDGSGVMNSHGIGILLFETDGVDVSQNIIGGLNDHATRTQLYTASIEARIADFLTENPTVDIYDAGYYATGVSLATENANVNITENIIVGDTGDDYKRDHVIYARGYEHLTISSNYFAGWQNDASGGVKLRNGIDTKVFANYFDNVSLLTYTYDNATPLELTDTYVFGNHFRVEDDDSIPDIKNPIYYLETNDFTVPDPTLTVSNYNIYANSFDAPRLDDIFIGPDDDAGETVGIQFHIFDNVDWTHAEPSILTSPNSIIVDDDAEPLSQTGSPQTDETVFDDAIIAGADITMMDGLLAGVTIITVSGLPTFDGLDNNFSYVELDGVVALDLSASISDSDFDALNGGAGNYDGASLVLSRFKHFGNNGDINDQGDADDIFGFGAMASVTVGSGVLTAGGNTIATFSTTLGVMTLNFVSSNGTTATTALVNEILAALTYDNQSQATPVGFDEDVSIIYYFSDGTDTTRGRVAISLIAVDNNDVFDGDDTDEVFNAGVGDDTVNALGGNDIINGEAGNDTLRGNDGNDIIRGGIGADSLFGHDGVDQLYGDGGNDFLSGGNGNDRVVGGDGDDTVEGDAGNDTVTGGNGNDTLDGGDGVDTINGNAGDDTANGGNGADKLYGHAGIDRLRGDAGDDFIYGGDDNDIIYGGTGRDRLYGDGGDDFINGGTDNDKIFGGDGNDTIEGDDGNDGLNGKAGNDTITGGLGNDGLNGHIGDDDLRGGDGDDRIYGHDGVDKLYGEVGNDFLNGGAGNDVMDGGDGVDYLDGEGGADAMDGGAGNDTLKGRGGNDVMNGNGGNDLLNGGDDDDELNGNDGDDRLIGGSGVDKLRGHDGVDLLEGGIGNDSLLGGAGNDQLFGEDGDDYLQGDGGNDRLVGGAGADTLEGNDGVDTLSGGDGNDVFDGGADNDQINGNAGDDEANGGTGADKIYGHAGLDKLRGDAGDDFLYGGDGNDSLFGGDGRDRMYGDNDDDFMDGGADNDKLFGGDGTDTLKGGTGNDGLNGKAGNDLLQGGDGNDSLNGNIGDDRLEGELGNDRMYGHEGADRLIGGDGDDFMDGGDDNDIMEGGAGVDYVDGGRGADTMDGGGGNDTLKGRGGNDIMNGNDGDDIVNGGTGDDELNGNAGVDKVVGESGNDTLRGHAGNDLLLGGAGDDTMFGGTENDEMWGGDGADFIDGEDGDDTIIGGGGDDELKGKAGNDTFSFQGGWGTDTVVGYVKGQDILDLTTLGLKTGGETDADAFAKLTVERSGANDTKIFVTGDPANAIILQGIPPRDVDEADFIFAGGFTSAAPLSDKNWAEQEAFDWKLATDQGEAETSSARNDYFEQLVFDKSAPVMDVMGSHIGLPEFQRHGLNDLAFGINDRGMYILSDEDFGAESGIVQMIPEAMMPVHEGKTVDGPAVMKVLDEGKLPFSDPAPNEAFADLGKGDGAPPVMDVINSVELDGVALPSVGPSFQTLTDSPSEGVQTYPVTPQQAAPVQDSLAAPARALLIEDDGVLEFVPSIDTAEGW